MVCFNCKAQIPDTSAICPNCGVNLALAPAGSSGQQPQSMPPQYQPQPGQISQAQMQVQSANARTHHEIKKRRWQRWFFYLVIIIIFVAMVGYMVMIYRENTNYVESINNAQAQLKEAQGNLATASQNLSTRDAEIAKMKQSTIDNQKALDLQMQELKRTMDTQSATFKDYDLYKSLGTSAVGTYATLVKVATNISAKDLQKIPLADFNLNNSTDSDNDGLSDDVEAALGTNPNNADTDGDKFSDKAEILSGYDPLLAGKKLALDAKLAAANRGKVFKEASSGYLWYVGFDSKRYFLGKSPSNISISPATPPVTTTSTSTATSTSGR